MLFRARQFEFRFPRSALVMGIVNVTPDSFSDGGKFLNTDAAVAHALELVAQGAEILDIGGESTRPGAELVSEKEELRRVIPVIEKLAAEINSRWGERSREPGVAGLSGSRGRSPHRAKIWATSFSITGMTRRSSSFSETGSAPGRVDSPPMSKISAPWATSSSAWATAASVLRNFPPSEKESGVTLTMPITSAGRGKRNSNWRARKTMCAMIAYRQKSCNPPVQISSDVPLLGFGFFWKQLA